MTVSRLQAIVTLFAALLLASWSVAQESEYGPSLPCIDTTPKTCVDDGLGNCTAVTANLICNTTQYTVSCQCLSANYSGCRCYKP